jgi:uncharacterized protein (DUF362 family)
MNGESGHGQIERRRFLKRIGRAALSVAAAVGAGALFYDPSGPSAPGNDHGTLNLPDFSMSGFEHRMSVVRGRDGSSRSQLLRLALKPFGGIEAFIKKGDRVVLKVNAAFASPPILSATTHPELVSAMTRLCLKAGAERVVVTDNPINHPESCFALTGIAQAARSEGARLMLPADRYFKRVTVPGARLIRQWPVFVEPLDQTTKVIGMAPVKDHHRSGASMSMKNWYGLLGGRRNLFHQDIHTIIKELAMMITPTLVILDGMTTMMTNGPTGGSLSDLRKTNTLIVSTDQVAADAYGAGLLNKQIKDLPFISLADGAGEGFSDYRSLNPTIIQAG